VPDLDRDDWNAERRRARPTRSTPPGRVGRRLMRRTMQPRRPLVYPDQWALVLLTAIAILGGIAAIGYLFLH
jgi:hypothetical protein